MTRRSQSYRPNPVAQRICRDGTPTRQVHCSVQTETTAVRKMDSNPRLRRHLSKKARASAARIGADFGVPNPGHRGKSGTGVAKFRGRRYSSWLHLQTTQPEQERHSLPTDQDGRANGRVSEGCPHHVDSACRVPVTSQRRCEWGTRSPDAGSPSEQRRNQAGFTRMSVVAINGIKRRNIELLVHLRSSVLVWFGEDTCDARHRCCAPQPRRPRFVPAAFIAPEHADRVEDVAKRRRTSRASEPGPPPHRAPSKWPVRRYGHCVRIGRGAQTRPPRPEATGGSNSTNQ